MLLSTLSLADYALVAKLVCSDRPTATLRLHLFRVKVFLKNILFFGNAIFRKGKCVQVFGYAQNSFYGNEILVFVSGIRFTEMRFTENHFQRLFLENIFWKMKFIFLQKIISHAWFVDHFTENNNFKHLHYLNKPVTVQKYSSKFKHLHCLDTSVIVQKYSSISTSKIII